MNTKAAFFEWFEWHLCHLQALPEGKPDPKTHKAAAAAFFGDGWISWGLRNQVDQVGLTEVLCWGLFFSPVAIAPRFRYQSWICWVRIQCIHYKYYNHYTYHCFETVHDSVYTKNFMRDIFLDLQALPDEKLDEKIIKPGKAVASSAGWISRVRGLRTWGTCWIFVVTDLYQDSNITFMYI